VNCVVTYIGLCELCSYIYWFVNCLKEVYTAQKCVYNIMNYLFDMYAVNITHYVVIGLYKL